MNKRTSFHGYQQAIKEIRENLRFVPVKVLVWGPGKPKEKLKRGIVTPYSKREDIKKELTKYFHRAEIAFSEDPELMALSAGINGQLNKEALQAKAADIVIVLDVSRGADLELDHFTMTYSWFSKKAYVFLPERFLPCTGLVNEVLKQIPDNQIYGYSQAEFDECTLAKVKAVEAVETTALAKYLQQ